MRVALTKLDGSVDWCVVVGASLFRATLTRKRTNAVLRVPALLSDLLPLAKGRPGSDDDSPSIEFVGMGLDAWAPTILYIDGVNESGRPTGRGRWAVGSWGAIVERGNYD